MFRRGGETSLSNLLYGRCLRPDLYVVKLKTEDELEMLHFCRSVGFSLNAAVMFSFFEAG